MITLIAEASLVTILLSPSSFCSVFEIKLELLLFIISEFILYCVFFTSVICLPVFLLISMAAATSLSFPVSFLLYKRCALSIILVSLADVACKSVQALSVSPPDSCWTFLMWTVLFLWQIFLPSVLRVGASDGFCFCIAPCKNKLRISVCPSGLRPTCIHCQPLRLWHPQITAKKLAVHSVSNLYLYQTKQLTLEKAIMLIKYK